MQATHIGRYEVVRVLGKGAMGVVYEARDPRLSRVVAVKTIQPEARDAAQAAAYEARFQTEARSVARLNHPNIVSVFDSGQSGDTTFLVMEFVSGVNLKHCLHHGVRFTPWGAVKITLDVLAALGHAHAQKILHRDVKPENILLDGTGLVKLTDFGIAKILDADDDNGTQVSGHSIGTPRYMSPEQVRGLPLDERSDLFSAGVMLFELLTARLPFDGANQYAVATQILNEAPVKPSSHNPAVPAELDAVLAQAMAKQPSERFQTAADFARALLAVAPALGGSDLTVRLSAAASLATAESATMMRWLQSRVASPSDASPRGEATGGTDVTEVSGTAVSVVDAPSVSRAHRPDGASLAQATGTPVRVRSVTESTHVPPSVHAAAASTLPPPSGSQVSEAPPVLSTGQARHQQTEQSVPGAVGGTRKRWVWPTAGVLVTALAIGGWWTNRESKPVDLLPSLDTRDARSVATEREVPPSAAGGAAGASAGASMARTPGGESAKSGAAPVATAISADRPAAGPTQEKFETARGVIAQVPNAQLMLVDVKEASDIRLVKRQITVRLRGVSPASRTGKPQRDKMQLEALLLGQQVLLDPCTKAGKELICDARVGRNRQADLRHDVGDLLVANGLATRQRP